MGDWNFFDWIAGNIRPHMFGPIQTKTTDGFIRPRWSQNLPTVRYRIIPIISAIRWFFFFGTVLFRTATPLCNCRRFDGCWDTWIFLLLIFYCFGWSTYLNFNITHFDYYWCEKKRLRLLLEISFSCSIKKSIRPAEHHLHSMLVLN